jgi:threonine dehydrogenase-like Zn-dependent dehydrogenase
VGASPLIALAMSHRRARSAVGIHGADEFVATGKDPGALARLEADIVIEAVGTSRAIVQAMSAVKPGGTVVLLGSSRDLGRDLDWRAIAQERDVRLVGAHISVMPAKDASAASWTYAQEGRLFLELLRSGRLHVADLTTWRVRPDQCNEVYEVIAQGGADQVGVVFDWQADPKPAAR